MKVKVIIEVDDMYADPDHSMGVTGEGYEVLVEAINAVGSIDDGPEAVSE